MIHNEVYLEVELAREARGQRGWMAIFRINFVSEPLIRREIGTHILQPIIWTDCLIQLQWGAFSWLRPTLSWLRE